MNKIRTNYDEDFKRSAVKLVVEEKRKVSEVSKNLGIHENLLHKWKKEYLKDPLHAFPGKGCFKPQDEEIRQLKKALRDAEMERDILKKAIAVFSRK